MSDILDYPTSIPLFEEDPQALLAMEPSRAMHAYMMHGSDQLTAAPSDPDQPKTAGGPVLHLIATSTARPFISRLVDACEQLEGAYSLVFLIEDKLVAVRDPHGFRLLVMGRRSNGAVVFASETCALDLIEAEYEREVNSGEVVVVDKDDMSSLCLLPQKQRKACMFEHIYFALPSSVVFGHSVYESRYEFGQILVEDAPADCDVVIVVPDSGIVTALGYAAKARLSFQQGLIRSHYVGRTFIEPSQKIWDFGVKLKLSLVHPVLEGKRVLVVDDSIVRGTTSSKIVRLIKDAGATKVHVRIASPPIIGSCYYGMDTPNKEQQWEALGESTVISFERVDEDVAWTDLFPKWIDKEEQYSTPVCPTMPMPEISNETKFDLVVTRLPCRKPEQGWSRDVLRLQIHIASANVAVRASRDGKNMAMLFFSSCSLMPDLFRCEDFVKDQGMDAMWLYASDVKKLAQKISLPVGSCGLAVSWKDHPETPQVLNPERREAYATILHSSEFYVCGAIALAQSIRMSGSTKDLIILVDKKVGEEKREGLRAAGWQVREIRRIRNPRAGKDSYNEWNYSKFRLWQLTNYDKIIFIDSDLLILRNFDFLFDLPEISATGNSRFVFNSGMMVIEPSYCTFRFLLRHRRDIISYNGRDQGYLNEVFTWWHMISRRMNYLKYFWSNDTEEYIIDLQYCPSSEC